MISKFQINNMHATMIRLLGVCSTILVIAFPAAESTISKHTFLNVDLPFYANFPEGVKPGLLVILDGLAKVNPDRFGIDFLRDVNNKKEEVFHLNPRFRQRSVVRNTKIDGDWGPEERERNLMPIKPKEQFQIAILVTSASYKVFINGKYFTDYKHRLPYSSVNKIGIWGDIIVAKLQIKYDPLFDSINNILPLLRSKNGNIGNEIMKHLFSKEKSMKLSESLFDGKQKRNVRFHFDLSVDDIKNNNDLKGWKNKAKPGFKIDANIPVNKK